MAQEVQILILLTVVIVASAIAGTWLIFKIFKRSERSAKENEIFADKNFVDYLNEENMESAVMSEFAEREKIEAKDAGIQIQEETVSNENEVLKLAKKYSVGQGEVELLLNLRSKEMRKKNEYARVVDEIEKGTDIRKVAKKYKIGCGEIQLLMNLKNTNQTAFLTKWRRV